MSLFERRLTLWVALCIVAGVALGHIVPGFFHAVGASEIAVALLATLVDQPVRLSVGHGAGDRGRRADRGAGDADFVWMVNRSKHWYERGQPVRRIVEEAR
jgi:ACR3 family arsenite transporter